MSSTKKPDPPKENPPKESPPKESPPKESPPKESPPKESPPKESPPKENPPKESPPKENPPKENPPKDESGAQTMFDVYIVDKKSLAAKPRKIVNVGSFDPTGKSLKEVRTALTKENALTFRQWVPSVD
jgi:hypothetical protein